MDRLTHVWLDGSMTHDTQPRLPAILVLGGAGKTGRRVARRLSVLGRPVRLASRSTTPAFDWTDPATWAPAVDGVGTVYVAYQPDLAAPGAATAIAELTRVARTQGVERLVLLSGRGEPAAQRCEDIALSSGVDTTVLRCSFFAQNFSEHFLVGPVIDGVVALPAGVIREPIVDADDIADVAATVLTEPGHAQRIYELTGPQLLSFADVAETLSATIGREIVYVAVTPDEYVSAAIAAGVPKDEATMLAQLFAHIFDGHNESLADGVATVLGRAARSFGDFASDAAATRVWSTS
jgi:uncharacterized protein YbjT (DUF2867 family)